MDRNKLIIIALLVIIVVLLVAIVAVTSNFNKTDTHLEIMGNDTLNEGDVLQLKLTDANGTALSNQTVAITITDSSSKTSDYHSVITNGEGVGELKLEKDAGEYDISVTYSGNDAYNGCNATKKVTIKEKVAEAEVTSSSSTGQSSWTDSDGVYHFYKNGQEYVGDPNAQHMTIEQHNYVKKHGMR